MVGRANTPEEKIEIMYRLLKLWLAYPDLRLAQLIGNIYPCGPMPDLPAMKGIIDGVFPKFEHRDPYSVEDFRFIDELERGYKL